MTFDRNRMPDPQAFFAEEGLNLVGPRHARWRTTRCTFHGGSDSMRVNVATGGWVCMACGAKGGDVLSYRMQAHDEDFRTAAMALGAWVEDGRPAATLRPATLPPRAALEVLLIESNLVAIAAGNLAQGATLSVDDRQRLNQAAKRIARVAEEYAR